MPFACGFIQLESRVKWHNLVEMIQRESKQSAVGGRWLDNWRRDAPRADDLVSIVTRRSPDEHEGGSVACSRRPVS